MQCGPHLDGLQLYCANQSPGDLVERLISVGLGWRLRLCIPDRLPGKATALLLPRFTLRTKEVMGSEKDPEAL